MTRTAVRHTIFALATLALLTVFTSLTAYAQSRSPFMGMKGAAITSAAVSGQPNAPKGLATEKRKPPQNTPPNTFILTDIESGFDTR